MVASAPPPRGSVPSLTCWGRIPLTGVGSHSLGQVRRFDRNGDGQLSIDEFAWAFSSSKVMKDHFGRPGQPPTVAAPAEAAPVPVTDFGAPDGTQPTETTGYTDGDGDKIEFALLAGTLLKYVNGKKRSGGDDTTGVVRGLSIKMVHVDRQGQPDRYDVRDHAAWGGNDVPVHVVRALRSMAQQAGIPVADPEADAKARKEVTEMPLEVRQAMVASLPDGRWGAMSWVERLHALGGAKAANAARLEAAAQLVLAEAVKESALFPRDLPKNLSELERHCLFVPADEASKTTEVIDSPWAGRGHTVTHTISRHLLTHPAFGDDEVVEIYRSALSDSMPPQYGYDDYKFRLVAKSRVAGLEPCSAARILN